MQKQTRSLPYGLRGALSILGLVHRVAYFERKPISLILVSRPQSGKSMTLGLVRSSKAVRLNDVTRAGLEELLVELDNMGLNQGIIVVPDMLKLTNEKGWQSLSSLLNVLTEEGVTRIKRFGKRRDIQFHRPLRLGIVGAITTDVYDDLVSKWRSTGFDSRLLKFFFHYSDADIHLRDDDIFEGVVFTPSSIGLHPEHIRAINSMRIDSSCKEHIKLMSKYLAVYTSISVVSDTARFQYQLQCIVRAHALYRRQKQYPVKLSQKPPHQSREEFFAEKGWDVNNKVDIVADEEDIYSIAAYMPNFLLTRERIGWFKNKFASGRLFGRDVSEYFNQYDVGGSDATWYLLRLFKPDKPYLSFKDIEKGMPERYKEHDIMRALVICNSLKLISYDSSKEMFWHFLAKPPRSLP